MPSRIPVRISDREFPSLNQARLHYVGILRKYQPGQIVSEHDGRQISELLPSNASNPSSELVNEIRVVQGNYGRTCFANAPQGSATRLISIMRSVKSFVEPPVLTAKTEPQVFATVAVSESGAPPSLVVAPLEVAIGSEEDKDASHAASAQKVLADDLQPHAASIRKDRVSAAEPNRRKLRT